MAAPAQQEQDSGLGPLWIAVALMLFAVIIWAYFSTYIVAALLKVKLVEAHLVGLFTAKIEPTIHWMQTVDPAAVKFNTLNQLFTIIGGYYAYPTAAILVVLAILLFVSAVGSRFQRSYDMNLLRKEEVVNWPQIAPVVGMNLVDVPLMEGPWSMAQTPMEFAKKNNLLRLDHLARQQKQQGFGQSKEPMVAKVRKGDATRVFALQLGAYYRGPEKLAIHRRALFAIFAARAAHDIAAGAELLKQISASTEKKELDFSGVDELLAKYRQLRRVVKLNEQHAYELTAMATMLQAGRQDGVLASADFLWLKPLDRPLWYMLNNVGRQTAFPEIAGAWAHWLAEKEIGHGVLSPMVQEAVVGLETAISRSIYKPDEPDMFVTPDDEEDAA